MPQDGSNNYQYPPGTPGVPDQTIESEAYNTFLDDLVLNDLNIPRPVHRGGTGGSTPDEAIINLSAEKAYQQITNYDAHIYYSGSFGSSVTATGAPVDGHAFTGIVYHLDTSDQNIVVEARDQSDTTAVGRVYVREKKAGVWGAWVEQVGSVAEQTTQYDARYVNVDGDTMTGTLAASKITISEGYAGNWQPKIIATSSAPLCSFEWGHSNPAYHATLGAQEGGGHPYISFNCGPGTTPDTFMTWTTSKGSVILGNDGAIVFYHVPLVYTDNQSGVAAAVIRAPNLNAVAAYEGATLNAMGGISASGLSTLYGIYCDAVGNRWEPGGNFVITGNGYKAGGGDWADSSDGRIKTVLGDYEHGLTEIMQVRPVRYVFKNNAKVIQEDLLREREDGSKPALEEAAIPIHEKEAAAQTPFIGVIAQEIEIPLPETVSRAIGFIDGKSVTDLRIYDSSALVYALINAVKELAARVEQLEAAG